MIFDQSEYIQRKIDSMDSPEQAENPNGPAVVETYMVIHDRYGNPFYSIIIARLEDDRRRWAQTEKDQFLLQLMETDEFIGRKGFVVTHDKAPNLIRF